MLNFILRNTNMVMDEFIRDIQGDISWCILVAGDVVLVYDIRMGVNKKLELWRQTLELEGFSFSISKTEYTRCGFSARHKALMGRWYLRWTTFDVWERCCRWLVISMKMWAVESKPDGSGGAKLLTLSLIRGCY